MTDDLEKKIQEKQAAIRSDAFLAKKEFDSQKTGLDGFAPEDIDDDYFPEVKELRHELKLMMALFSESKFDDIVHLISNPTRLLGLNFIIGFVRGLGFALAVLLIIIIVLASLSDTVIFGS
ncbi:MAG: hypothetical protein ACON35_02910 [Candidatus Marinamargulisbacteria bacterium]